jgi:hypothetical protein
MDTAQLHTLAREVASELGWKKLDGHGENYPTAYIQRDDGLKLALHGRHGAKGRVVVAASEDLHHDASRYDLTSPEITCSLERRPIDIARDIEQRLTVKASAYRAEVQKRNKACEDYAALTAAAVQALVAGGADGPWSHSSETTLGGPHGARMRVHGDSVRFEYMSVPLSVALEVLRVLRAGEAVSK